MNTPAVDRQAGARIHVSGVVQGVGFRPFIYGLAARLGLTGWVRNTSAGVDIEVNGLPETLHDFVEAIRSEPPPLARIDEVDVQSCPPDGFTQFEIIHSEAIAGAFQPISPDVSTCPDCLRELFDPQDRRYRYPFINCTHCGPRFTIIEDIPYDRPKTTMASFPICPACEGEYRNPLDRRFHAQPVACPECGPHIWLELAQPQPGLPSPESVSASGEPALLEAQRMLQQGKILAIKGLGGFHLACNAVDRQAVEELRRRKLRVDKPFAIMMPDLAEVEKHCLVSETERQLLESRERPVVLLHRRPESKIAAEVAPGQHTLGVMLPYTPLHYLLFSPSDPEVRQPPALVMTSGNLSEEPIAIGNEEARQRLSPLADAFLMHNRPIRTRCDDSVMRVLLPEGVHLPIRRSRGYAPYPVRLPWSAPAILAAGAELKNTFCVTREGYAFLSHHIGDLENWETLRSFEEGISDFERLYRVRPQALAYDLHPDYLATRWAQDRAAQEGLAAYGVQHHHAHIAACMAEHGLTGDDPVIGVAFDGAGYGDDGAIWGGEILVADYAGYWRAAHLAYMPLPGGDAATRKPARIALAYLWQAGHNWDPGILSVKALGEEERAVLLAQLGQKINTPLTSSMGRLFDAAAALAGVRQSVNYEAQAAIEFEALVDPTEEEAYAFTYIHVEDQMLVEPEPVLEALLQNVSAGVPIPIIAARFHNGIARMVLEVCREIRSRQGLSQVVLSGGVWQNVTLLKKALQLLRQDEFIVYTHQSVPSNDGGLALGQAAIASWQLRE